MNNEVMHLAGKINTASVDSLICPYCGYSHDLQRPINTEMVCNSSLCGKTFFIKTFTMFETSEFPKPRTAVQVRWLPGNLSESIAQASAAALGTRAVKVWIFENDVQIVGKSVAQCSRSSVVTD